MELPGGLLHDGSLQRDLSFKPVTGTLERIVSESGFGGRSLAEQVTIILSNALEKVAGFPANEEIVRLLSSGDRHYLMQQLEAMIDPSPKWLTSPCQECSELIQFQFVPGTFPVKSAGKQFPKASISLSVGYVDVRVPTGKDEETVAFEARDEVSAEELLLKRLVTLQDGCMDINSLTVGDRELIEQTLDDMTPQSGNVASIECPYCNHSQVIAIDSYDWIMRETRGLDQEIHTLALHYHWSEKEILDLPRVRRKGYIQLIERSLGKYQAEDFMSGMSRGVVQ